MNKSRLITVAIAVGVVAAMYRVDTTRELLTGDQKFLGIF